MSRASMTDACRSSVAADQEPNDVIPGGRDLSHLDVVTRDKQGQWVNEVEEANELSLSFSSREEAVEAGIEFARQHGSRHTVEDAVPSGVITDGGGPDDGVAVVGERPARSDGLPETTDDNGLPLDNPSG